MWTIRMKFDRRCVTFIAELHGAAAGVISENYIRIEERMMKPARPTNTRQPVRSRKNVYHINRELLFVAFKFNFTAERMIIAVVVIVILQN